MSRSVTLCLLLRDGRAGDVLLLLVVLVPDRPFFFFVGELLSRSGTFTVRVIVLVLPLGVVPLSLSSGSASTVTLMRQGLSMCSVTVFDGDVGISVSLLFLR